MIFNKTVQLLFRVEKCTSKRYSSQVSFIGIGEMGSRMATNLIKNGTNLKVYDIVPEARSKVQGAKVCDNLKDVVEGSNIVFTMLPNGNIVKETVLGSKGILQHLPKNTILIDCSTIEPQAAVDLQKASAEKNVRFLDAPVSGGVTGAGAATLTFMTGGDKSLVKEVEPILLRMGKNVYHCGDTGAGQVAKICNNLILAITMIGTSEAMNLGIKLGLDPQILTNIVNVSTGRSWSSETYNPVPGLLPNVPSSNDYKGGFSVPLIAKDLGIAESAALSCGAPVPLTAAAHQLYRILLLNGYKEKDFSCVFKFLKGQ